MKRKIYKLLSSAKQGLFALALTVFSGTAYSQTTYTFNYTGGQQTLALGAGTYDIKMWGANGGNSNNTRAGIGGYSNGTLTLPSSTTLYIVVGGTPLYTGVIGLQPGGYNGGGTGYANGTGRAGGGATHIATASGTLAALVNNTLAVVIVAGGGGGDQNAGLIGHGGGLTGGGTYPGTQTSSAGGIFGSFGQGGDITISYGGGGGGGWYGGGGNQNNAGSGGSGFIGGVTNAVTTMSGQTAYVPNPDVSGNGRVVITSLCNISLTNASTTGPGPICSGNSATITTNAVSNYSWSNGSTTSSLVVSPTVTTQYTLTATSPLNCTASSAITVIVNSGTPTVTAMTTSSAICAGGTVTMTASGANSYTWTNGVTNAVTYTPTATNIYTVTGANACATATAAVGVTVSTSPVVIASVNTPTVCNGSSVTFTSGGNATTYVWSNGVVSGVPYIPTATDTYTLIGTANGCSSVSVVGVTVLVTPLIPPAATPTAICLGSTATLSATGATGYTWNPGSNPNTSTIAVSPPGSTTYTLLRSNGLCSSTATINLVVNPLPLVNATASPTQICSGSGVNLVVVGPITNTWLPGGFTSANFTLFPNNSTCYTVTGSNGNCTATAAVCVTVNPNPPITITSSTNTICEGQNVTLTAGGALTYTWLASNSNNLTETTSPPATTLITVSGSNSFGCTASINQLILVNSVPNMSLTSSQPYLCAGQAGVLSIANPTPNVNYVWSNGPSGVTNPVTPTITTNYTATGTNSITGCTASNTIAMAVYISTFVVSSPSAICNGQSATLSASGSATSYSWNIGTGTVSPSVVVSPVLNTTYTVTGINGNCQSIVPITLTVNPLPNVTATVAKSQICKFEIATVTAGGASTYTWDTNATTPTLTFTLGITTTYTVTGTDSKGCSKTATVTQYVATCIGIENLETSGIGLNIYPNPNNGTFMIRSDESITLDIVNTLGQVITTIKLSDGNAKEVTVDRLPTGIYYITGQGTGQKINKKIIVGR